MCTYTGMVENTQDSCWVANCAATKLALGVDAALESVRPFGAIRPRRLTTYQAEAKTREVLGFEKL